MHGSDQSRALRSTETHTEDILWRHLRSKQVNSRKWRRQHAIGKYIVDFFCWELRLVIEVDGDVHAFQEEKDAVRQAYIEGQGFRVLRFTNQDILNNLDGVLTVIWEETR